MTARIRVPLTLLALVLSACLVAAAAEAQTPAPAAAKEDAGEAAQSDPQEEDEGFWGSIVSSFVDFFGGDSEETGEDEDRNDDKEQDAKKNPAADDHDPTQDAEPEDAEEREPAAGEAEAVSAQPKRRPNLRHAEPGGDDATTGHVYRATADLVSEIGILRDALNVDASPGKAPPREHRAPIHVYAKSLEVLEKTSRFQRRLGMIPAEVGHMPVGPVSEGDLHRGVQAIVEELRRVKRQLVVGDEIDPAPLSEGRTSTLTYQNLVHASLLLDGLVGRPTSANDLYRHMLRVHDEMLLVAAELGVSLDLEPPAVEGERETVAVAQQVVRAANKVANLQVRLGMDASRPPGLAFEDATAADVFDATNFLLAEMARIKAHLGVRQPGNGSQEARDRTTADVFARVLLVIRNLDIMSKAADGAGQELAP